MLYHRSIPTCVGQPVAGRCCTAGTAVYPHVCGAAHSTIDKAEFVEGLSPRVWGSRHRQPGQRLSARSIPTCVGQPSLALFFFFAIQVYPHVCGAASVSHIEIRHPFGLSPRVWGSPYSLVVLAVRLRSIPTCVGQPPAQPYAPCTRPVYPHVCGAAK